MTKTILEVNNLSVDFNGQNGLVNVVKDISFKVEAGECLGIIGESGCGKTITSLAIMQLIPPSGRIASGEIIFEDLKLRELGQKRMESLRGSKLAMIFQNPMSSLNPCFTIGKQLVDVAKRHSSGVSKQKAHNIVISRLRAVGFSDPESRFYSYPFELSGGLCQRAMIAMALLSTPRLLIADEPTTALDVSIQAQILDLIKELQDKLNFSLIFVSHDLAAVQHMASNILVMYAGNMVEYASAETFFKEPKHPYSKGLLNSCLSLNIDRNKPISGINGEPPDLFNKPKGCPFEPRCTMAQALCCAEKPALVMLEDGRMIACHLFGSKGVD